MVNPYFLSPLFTFQLSGINDIWRPKVKLSKLYFKSQKKLWEVPNESFFVWFLIPQWLPVKKNHLA